MHGFYFMLPTLLIIFVSLLIVRAGAVALMLTGVDEKRAKFQALSAFSGTGFTTHESEAIVNNPARRRIVSWLMVLGNAGIVTVIVAGTSSFVTSRKYDISFNLLFLAAGLFLIYQLATRKRLIRRWETFIEDRFLRSRVFDEAGTEDLLHFIEGYGLVRHIVDEKSSLKDSTLADCRLNVKGILVLGIEREGAWLPTPKAGEVIHEGDRLVMYGPLNVLKARLRDGDTICEFEEPPSP